MLRLPVLVNFKSIYFKYPTILNRPPPSIHWPVFLFFRNIIKNDSKKLSNTVTWLRHFYCEMNLHGCQSKFSLILRRSFSGVRGPFASLPRERERSEGAGNDVGRLRIGKPVSLLNRTNLVWQAWQLCWLKNFSAELQPPLNSSICKGSENINLSEDHHKTHK